MSGWRLLLTRPAEDCAALAATLAEQGIYSSSLPLLGIEALAEAPEHRGYILELDRYSAVIVVSKPAARLALQLLDRYRPQVPPGQAWFSVGAATGTILDGHGLDVSWPAAGDDSEALLALPRLADAIGVPEPKVLIVRGEGGREHIADTLREKGVQVDSLQLYRRYLPDYPPGVLLQTLRSERLNGLVVSSGQGLQSLRDLAGADWNELLELPLFVPSPRVAQLAAQLGAKRIVDCRGAGTTALLAALREHPSPLPDAKDGNVSEVDSDKPAQQPKGNNEPVIPAKEMPPKQPADRTQNSASRGLAGIALVVGLAGLAAGGYSIWQTQQLAEQGEQHVQTTQAASEQTRQLAERSQQLTNRLGKLEQLPSAEQLEDRRRLLSELQSDQQRLAGRVEQVLGASREQWRLAEAEHLLRMAMLRLSAMEDVNSAASLVAEADLILRKQDDPGAYAARQKLLEGLEALRSLPELDRTGLFLQLGALRGQANELNGLAPEFEAGQGEGQSESRWQHWLNELTRYVRIDFDAGTNVKPLLAGQSLAQVRLALSLAIEQAQWAVLNSNEKVYRQSLDQAAQLIADHFSEENGQSRGLRDRIEALRERQVSVQLPDLAPALQAMQSYVQKRESAESAGAPGNDDTAQPEGASEQPATGQQSDEGQRT